MTLVKIALLVEKIGTAFIFGSQTEPNSFFSAKRPAGYYALAGLVFRNPGCHARSRAGCYPAHADEIALLATARHAGYQFGTAESPQPTARRRAQYPLSDCFRGLSRIRVLFTSFREPNSEIIRLIGPFSFCQAQQRYGLSLAISISPLCML